MAACHCAALTKLAVHDLLIAAHRRCVGVLKVFLIDAVASRISVLLRCLFLYTVLWHNQVLP